MSETLKCEICGFESPDTHLYCGLCGNGLAIGRNSADTSIINAPIEGERKQVTIIFADISGFTALCDPIQLGSISSEGELNTKSQSRQDTKRKLVYRPMGTWTYRLIDP